MQTKYRSPQDWRNSSEYEDTSVAGQFVSLAKEFLIAGQHGPVWDNVLRQVEQRPHNGRLESFAKMAVASVGLDLWGTADAQALSDAYLRAFAPHNLIDACKRFAYTLPNITGTPNVVVATGTTAHEVEEGKAKPLTRFTLTVDDTDAAKVVATVVLTKELARAKGPDAENFFRRLLLDAVIEASNSALLSRLPKDSIAGGATAVESLKLGLAAAPPSNGYVVAATHAATRELALAADGRMGINGGEYIEGVIVLPALEATSAATSMVVIPASGLAIRDRGLALQSSGHASVEMQDEPTGDSAQPTPVELVNLWQCNLLGLKVERLFEVRATESAIEVA